MGWERYFWRHGYGTVTNERFPTMALSDKHRLPSEVIRKRRDAIGLDHATVAAAMGINKSSYYDLEDFETEIWTCVEIIKVCRLCRFLKLTPDEVFEGSESSSGVAPHQGKYPVGGLASLRLLIADELARTGESVSKFEDRVGWELQGFLAGTESGLNWNMDGLADICQGCGADWLAVLQNEFDSGNWERQGGKGNNREGHL